MPTATEFLDAAPNANAFLDAPAPKAEEFLDAPAASVPALSDPSVPPARVAGPYMAMTAPKARESIPAWQTTYVGPGGREAILSAPNLPEKQKPDWLKYFSGIENLNKLPPQEQAAFKPLDTQGDKDPKLAQTQAILRAYFSSHGVPDSVMDSDWESTKVSALHNIGWETPGVPLFFLADLKYKPKGKEAMPEKISDSEAYNYVGKKLSDEAAHKSWLEEIIDKPILALPRAPKDLPNVPEMGLSNPALAAGIYNAVADKMEGFSSPLNVAMVGGTGEIGLLAKTVPAARAFVAGISGYFAYSMAKATFEEGKNIGAIVNDPQKTMAEKTEAVTGMVIDGAMALAATTHAATSLMSPVEAKRFMDRNEGKNPAEIAKVLANKAEQTANPEAAAAMEKAAQEYAQLGEYVPPDAKQSPIIIEAAAVKSADGTVTEGVSHEAIPAEGEQGFTLSNGSFVDRKEAMRIARESGQLMDDIPPTEEELHSHMVDMPIKEETVAHEVAAIDSAPAEEHLSSVKKSSVNTKLKRMGFQPVTPTETKTWTAGVNGALERFDKDPERGANLVRRALAGETRFNDDDVWDSQVHQSQLEEAIIVAEKRYDEALKAGDEKGIAAADAELYDKQATLKQASQAFNEVMGSVAGRALNARKAMLKADYSVAALERKWRKSTGKPEIPPEVQKQLEEKSAKITELEDQLNKSLKARARAREETRERARPPVKQSVIDRLSVKADEARERLAKRGGFSASVMGEEGPNRAKLADNLQDVSIIVADMIVKTGIKAADIAGKLVAEFGESIRPHVDDVIARAKDVITSQKLADVIERRVTQLETQIKTLDEKIKLGDLSPQGVKASRPSIEEIEKLQQKRDSMRDELSRMRKEAGDISDLEKAIAEKNRQIAEGDIEAKGKPVNRPASEAKEKLLRERDELNEKIAKARREESKPSQADIIAKEVEQIEKQISEKKAKLKSGDIEPEGKQANRPAVQEIELARQQLDKVNAELAEARKALAEAQKGPPEPEEPAPTPEQKRVKALDREIADIEKQIKNEEVFPKEKKPGPTSPEIVEREKRLEELKAERQNIRDRLRPPEETALKAWRTRTNKEIARLKAREPKPERVPLELPFTPEDLKKQEELNRLKAEVNRELRENELARRPAWMKGAEVVKWVGETAILSSAAIFLKIPASAFWKPFFAPAKEFIGTTAGKIFPQAQKYAQMQVQPTYAALLSGELKAVKETVTTGARAAKEAALNRMTQEEALYVPDSLPPEAKDFLRSIHRSLHLPAQINEFSRRVSTRENNFRAQGLEQSLEDPAVWSTIRVRAYTESYRAAFLEKDSLASGIINAAIRDIEQKGKTYNAETLAALATMIIELDNPIKTVPVNVVSQTGEAVAGSITGTWQIYKAYRKGFKDMKPNDLDAAFRQLKNGSMGALAMIGAWYAYQNIGGSKVSGSIYDNPDKKRDKNLPAEGQVRVGGITLPALGFHNETWAAAQMVASYRHLLDSQYGKETVALNYDDILRAALGPMKDVPGIKQTFVLQLAETKEPLKTLSQWTASRMVPAGVAQIARWMDTPGDLDIDTFFKQPTKRFPTNFKEELEVRIPGLRQDVSKFKRDPSTTYRK